jgi:hypothetical protein
MATDINAAIKNAVDTITKYVNDIATMTVETRYIDVGNQTVTFDASRPIARTEIRLDGDCTTVLPGNPGQGLNAPGQMTVDSSLFSMHQSSVAMAIEYRARMLGTLLQALQHVGGVGGFNLPTIPNIPGIPTTPVTPTTGQTTIPPAKPPSTGGAGG